MVVASSSCGRCNAVSYCSEKCQRDDWKYHKSVCIIFRRFPFSLLFCLHIFFFSNSKNTKNTNDHQTLFCIQCRFNHLLIAICLFLEVWLSFLVDIDVDATYTGKWNFFIARLHLWIKFDMVKTGSIAVLTVKLCEICECYVMFVFYLYYVSMLHSLYTA